MKLSDHFDSSEFACHCGCGSCEADSELLKVLEELRTHFGRPVIITSGYRCETHNANVGGAKKSQHLFGKAADVRVPGISADKVHAYLIQKYPNQYGIGKYENWTHIDVRNVKARWGNQ